MDNPATKPSATILYLAGPILGQPCFCPTVDLPDALVVLDEAHLVPPFEKFLEAIANGVETFGPHDQKDRKIVPSLRLRVVTLTSVWRVPVYRRP